MRRLQQPPQLGPDGEIGAFLDDLRRQDRATLTIHGYGRDLALFVRWYQEANGEPMVAAKAIDEDILDFKSYMRREKHFGASTVNRRLCSLRQFFKWAVAVRLCTENPTTQVRDVKAASVPPKNLSHKDEKRLVHAVKRSGHVRNIAIVMTMLHCGLRCGEMVNFYGAPFAG